MGLLESIIRSAQEGGGGGLGDVLEQLGRGGQSSTGETLDEIQRRMGQQTTGNAPAGSNISVRDLEEQLGIGRNSSPSGYQQQSYPQQQPYPQQQSYPQQQPYPEEAEQQPQQQQKSGGLFGGGLTSILKVIGIGALAAYVLKKFTK